jgi:hypothetical protein
LKTDPQADAAREVTNTILTTLEQAGFGATAEGLPEIKPTEVPGLQTEAGRQAIAAAADATTPPGLAEALAMKALPAEAEARELLEAEKKKKSDRARILASLPAELQPAGVVALNSEAAGVTASTTNLLVQRMIAQLPPDKRQRALDALDEARRKQLLASAARTWQTIRQDADAERAGAKLRQVYVDDGILSQEQADGLSNFQLGVVGQAQAKELATQTVSDTQFFMRMAGTLAVATTTDFLGNVRPSFTPAQVASRSEQLTRMLHPEFSLEGLGPGERAATEAAGRVAQFTVGVTGADFLTNTSITELAANALAVMIENERNLGVPVEEQLEALKGALSSKLDLRGVDNIDKKMEKLLREIESRLP